MPLSAKLEPLPMRSAKADLGFRPLYHRDAVNHCPGCSHTQWYIGRFSAECAFCGTALPFQEAASGEARPVRHLGPIARWQVPQSSL